MACWIQPVRPFVWDLHIRRVPCTILYEIMSYSSSITSTKLDSRVMIFPVINKYHLSHLVLNKQSKPLLMIHLLCLFCWVIFNVNFCGFFYWRYWSWWYDVLYTLCSQYHISPCIRQMHRTKEGHTCVPSWFKFRNLQLKSLTRLC